MKLIKRIGAILVTVAMLCSLLMFVPNNAAPKISALDGAGIPGANSPVLYWGCDVSFYNVNDQAYANYTSTTDSGADYSLVDFERMKADGCDFVILRLGSADSSGNYYDPHFVKLYNMARAADMDIGFYFYSMAYSEAEAIAEAEFCIDVIESYGMYFEYPAYIDIEESDQLALGEDFLSTLCYAWCETMVDAGYFPGIYGNYNLYDNVYDDVKNTYDFWLAWVTSSTSISANSPSTHNLSNECGMWQYSFYGYEYDGIGLDMLDVNVSYKDYPTIMATYGYNNVDEGSGSGSSIPESYNPTVDENGDYTFENAYGFEFDIDDVDGVIEGEDATIITSATAYESCNPNWAISVQLRPTEVEGEYEVVTVVETPGSAEAANLTWEDGDIVMVVHSAASQPGYSNWKSKVAALSLNPGDIVQIASDNSTVTIVDPNPSTDPEDPEDPEDPTDTVITSIEFRTDATSYAGNTLFTPTLYSVNGSTTLANTFASQSHIIQWWNEAGTSQYASGTTFVAGTTYDLYIRFVCADGYTIGDNCSLTVTAGNGTYTTETYDLYTDSTNYACDAYITATEAPTDPEDPEDPEEPVEKFVINSLEFSTTANSPALNGTVFVPTLVSVNGDSSLVDYVKENHSIWYTFYNYEVEEYTESTFGLLNLGHKYNLYFSITANDTAEFASGCTLSLTTANGVHSGIVYENTTSAITFDIYFQTETVSVEDQTVYITGFNTSIVAGAAQIFTPDEFSSVTSSNANITWTMNAIAKYDEKLDAYVVTQVFAGGGDSTLSYELADDEIFIAVHDWETGVTDGTEVEGSAQNFANLGEVQVGMILNFTDIDLDTKTLGTSPTITFSVPVDPIVSLGAQANAELGGIRFGATYNKVVANGEVTGLGFLILSADKLGNNVLDLDYVSNSAIAKYVANVECRTIASEDYVAGMAFEDYTSFTFYATVIGLGNYADETIVAVPYITYLDGSVYYGETISNSLNGVLNGESSF